MKPVANVPGLPVDCKLMDKNKPVEPIFPQLLVTTSEGEGYFNNNNKENVMTNPSKHGGNYYNSELLSSNEMVNQSIGDKRRMYRISVVNSNGISNQIGEKSKKKKKHLNSPAIERMTVDLHDNITQDVSSIQAVKHYNNTIISNDININNNQGVNKLKRSKSERIQKSRTCHPDVNGYNNNSNNNIKERESVIDRTVPLLPLPTQAHRLGGIYHSRSVVYKNGEDLPRIVTQRKPSDLPVSRSDGFIIKPIASKVGPRYTVTGDYINYNNKLPVTEGVTGGGASRRKLGDTKALIDRYMNPEPVVYQSDLSFLFKDKSAEQVASTLGSSFATWNKRDRSKEELNMLDLGNSYGNKRKKVNIRSSIEELTEPVHIMKEQSVIKTSSGINHSSVSPRSSLKQQIADDVTAPNGSIVKTKGLKKVLFNEDTTEILDIHEVEAPIEFAIRIGRQSTEVLSNHRDSIVSTPIDSSYASTPIPPKPILKCKTSLEPENINWADCYQWSSGEESDTCSDPGSYSYKDYLRNTGSSRFSLPTLSLSGSMVSHSHSNGSHSNGRNMVSPRTRMDVTSPGSRRSRSRGSNKSNSFQCSKEFALVLQNLDSDDEGS